MGVRVMEGVDDGGRDGASTRLNLRALVSSLALVVAANQINAAK